jgi:cysteine desulfurase/selenocysteine lyase
VAPIDSRGALRIDELEKRLSPRTKLVALGHVSNALGTVNPIREITALAHARGIPVLVDGAQAVPRLPVDVQELGCDFYAFSAHKMYGPSGVGVLWAREAILEAMPPWQGGGDMISSVTFEKSTWNVLPHKFEAGTPNIAGVVALGAAIDYLRRLGIERIAAHEDALLAQATAKLAGLPGLRIVGTAPEKAAVVSFTLEGIHPHDIGTVLDQEGVAVRTGHHCAQPVMDFFGVPATARASFGLYNAPEEIDALVAGVRRAIEMFR